MEKIARICWNTHDWKRPSGIEGKSRSNESYEKISGFGHEEWLLDETKVLSDGYHYGFIQAMNTKTMKHAGQCYDIHLFTISPEKKKIYIGCLHNAIGISTEESKQVFKEYKKWGWIAEMKDDIEYVNGDVKSLNSSLFANVKFKMTEAKINYSNKPIIQNDSLGHRYNLMNKKEEFKFEIDSEGYIETLDTNYFLRINEGGEIIIDPLQKKIQNAVVRLLEDQYIHLYLEQSNSETRGQKVDIKGIYKETDDWHFFEIKTSSAKRCIREALGQILEYAHYPSMSRAKKLYIIGPEAPDEQDKAYMQKLRATYGLPIWFRWYSFVDNKLSDDI